MRAKVIAVLTVVLAYAAPAFAGQPHLARVVAWDPEKDAFLEARWPGISQEDPAPKVPATNYYLRVGGESVAYVGCADATLEIVEPVPSLGWKKDQTIALAPGECVPRELAGKIPGLKLSLAKEAGPSDRYRVRRIDGSKTISATRKKRAVVEERRGKGWVKVETIDTYAVPAIAEVFSAAGHHVIIVRLDISTEALGIPSSTELAIFHRPRD